MYLKLKNHTKLKDLNVFVLFISVLFNIIRQFLNIHYLQLF